MRALLAGRAARSFGRPATARIQCTSRLIAHAKYYNVPFAAPDLADVVASSHSQCETQLALTLRHDLAKFDPDAGPPAADAEQFTMSLSLAPLRRLDRPRNSS
jgi:hypothetical protein